MVGKTIHYCNRCDYKSNRRPNVKRHFSKMHTNLTSSAVERSQQFPLQQPSQQSLPNINVPMQVPIGSGQNKVAYSDDDDTLSENSYDSESDSENNTTEPG